MVFQPVPPKVDVNEVEEEQLAYWKANRIFERTMEEREGQPKYVFYEGPPTANGIPGSHHVLARAFKDMFPRYKTMRGFYSLRKGGWDTHGLPVEIAVQKELGIEDKQGIVEYGIDKFNKMCKESVFRNIGEWEKLTERTAYWVSLEEAYVTYTNDYIESIWWVLKQFWEKGLLYRGLKVVPYSPVSGTPLSSHEVSLGYKTIVDPSVYVRFKLKGEDNSYFLAWTTTPWTLPSNVALAVGADMDYVRVEGPNGTEGQTEILILAEKLIPKALKNASEYTITERMKGADLVKQNYEPLFDFFKPEQDHAYVVAGDFVSTEDGTGIVHIAPAYGVDDMQMGRENDLPVLQAVNEEGKFVTEAEPFAGMWFKDADKEIMRDLKQRGLLYNRKDYEHNYPHDWRTGTPLMYLARETWFIEATKYKQEMVDLNQTVNWVPSHIRDGRFGNWLDDLKDWALGRERFWGTPLPVWVDEDTGEELTIGSVAELSELAGRDLRELDLHRPYVDEITFPNPNGGGTMRRVPEVIDVWFDSGAMPYAQWGYPANNQEEFAEQYPADYICEAVDQTRGWFYSLHAISSMLNQQVAFKNVICLGHILDGEGQKMSKSKGNTVNPWDVLNKYGADTFRWYLYTSGPPGEPRRFSVDLVGQSFRAFWLTLWNTYSFFVTYANIEDFNPAEVHIPVSERDSLDQWVLSELNVLVRNITQAFEEYDATGATRPIEAFVDDLSNWYLRRSRRRFWDGEQSAYLTLHECLVTIAKLLAPTMPFMADVLYRNLVVSVDSDAPDSVHLAMWPTVNEALINQDAMKEMRLVMKLVSLGHAARNSAQVKVRQPLAEVSYSLPQADQAVIDQYGDIIADELNVKTVNLLKQAESVVTYSLNPIPALLGKKYGADFPKIQKYLRQPEQAEQFAKPLLTGSNINIQLNGLEAELTPEEVEVQINPAEGFAVAEDAQYLAALNITISEELALEGLAREVVRRVQTLRRDADFDIDDHIALVYTASEQVEQAVERFSDFIQTETLVDELTQSDEPNGEAVESYAFDDETLTIGIRRLEV